MVGSHLKARALGGGEAGALTCCCPNAIGLCWSTARVRGRERQEAGVGGPAGFRYSEGHAWGMGGMGTGQDGRMSYLESLSHPGGKTLILGVENFPEENDNCEINLDLAHLACSSTEE